MTNRYERIRKARKALESLRKRYAREAAHPAITHCEECGCDWLDNGLNPVGCPYCKQFTDAKILVAERDALEAENKRLRAEVERLRDEGAWAVRWAPGSAYWSEVLVELFGPDARKGIDVLEARWRKELERAEKLEEALRLAEEHINDITPEWYNAGQRVLAAIRAAKQEQGDAK